MPDENLITGKTPNRGNTPGLADPASRPSEAARRKCTNAYSLEQNDRERGRDNRYQQRAADSGAHFTAVRSLV